MIAIRDDDTSYWTDADDLEKLYGSLIDQKIKISFAVIPRAYRLIHPGDRRMFCLSDEQEYIYENKKLVDFLIPLVRSGLVEIMQHGYDHSYYVEANGEYRFLNQLLREKIGNNVPDKMVAECLCKPIDIMAEQIREGKEILEDTFHTKVRTFVPPSNAINACVVSILDDMGMNLSGTMTNRFNRKKDVYSLSVYMKKIIWKMQGWKMPYPYLMHYHNHNELVGHSFTPATDYSDYIRKYELCKRIGCHFTIATHYWELLNDRNLRKQFELFISSNLTIENSHLVKELM